MVVLALDEFFPKEVEGMEKNLKMHRNNTMWQHRKCYVRTVLELHSGEGMQRIHS
ncbi:uncharacterized protein J3R85_001207 [Psidium guajava]|nr:uncharacterized protein J3R85_001207 [Psidium guajava]